MKAIKYLITKKMMCNLYKDVEKGCSECPASFANNGIASCYDLEHEQPCKMIEIVNKWSDKNLSIPLIQIVMDKFPKADREEIKHNNCPSHFGLVNKEIFCSSTDCGECWDNSLYDFLKTQYILLKGEDDDN